MNIQKGTEDQYITSADGEDLRRNVHMRRSEIYAYIIHDGDYYSIVDKDNIRWLMDEIEQKIIWMFQRNFI